MLAPLSVTRMPTNAAHNRSWQIAEVVFGGPFVVALLLQRVIPMSLPRGLYGLAWIIGGGVLAVIGVAIIALGRQELARLGQPTDPGHPTTNIVTSGVYSLSRNPLYLGATCFLAGAALAFNLPWVLVLLLPSLVLCHFVLIAPEERYLAARFGDEYREYARSVNRWFGRGRKRAVPAAGHDTGGGR
ncbi:MAG: isoprenylcysteine carboxylmethyltransferase family protein [Thermomicrobiales bacterium]